MKHTPTDVAIEQWPVPASKRRRLEETPPADSGEYAKHITRASNQISDLLEARASHPRTAISTACRLLGLAAHAHTVALRSLNRDAMELVGGWSRADMFREEPALIQLRPEVTFDRPILALRPDDMPITLGPDVEFDTWSDRVPANPQSLFCPIRTDGRTVGFVCIVGDRALPWSPDVVRALSLASRVIGQFQVRAWAAREHDQRLAMAQFILEASHELYDLGPAEQITAMTSRLETLGQMLEATAASLWAVDQGRQQAERIHFWHHKGEAPTFGPILRPEDTPAHFWNRSVVQPSEHAISDTETVFVVLTGLRGDLPKLCLGIIRPTGSPLRAWEKLEVARFADLLAVTAEKSAGDSRLEATFTHAPTGISLRRVNGDLVDCNQAYLDFLGVETKADINPPEAGLIVKELLTPDIAQRVEQLHRGDFLDGQEVPYRRADNTVTWGLLSVAAITVGEEVLMLTHVEDVTEKRDARRIINLRAATDALTGLANRHTITDRLETLVAAPLPDDQDLATAAVVLVDLDGFKEINDQYGHAVGDTTLVAIGNRLQAIVKSDNDVVGRLGGDEFILILEGPITRAEAMGVAERLKSKLLEPIRAGAIVLRVGASVGVALTTPGATADDLLARADTEMYNEKFLTRVRRGALRSEDGIEIIATRRESVHHPIRIGQPDDREEAALKAALERREIVFWGQPIVHALSGRPQGVELLARWPQRDGTIVGPDQFIPVAERSGLTVELGRQALAMASRLLTRWAEHDEFAGLGVNVNISPQHLQNGLLLADVEALLPSLPAEAKLGIELIESSLPRSAADGLYALETLRRKSVNVIIDDFGVGHSSLSRLQEIPASNLKLDKSFLSGTESNAQRQAFFRAIVDLLHAASYPVTAEGVETDAQRALGQSVGVASMQGFLIARPAPIEHTERVLRQLFAEADSSAPVS